MTVFARPRYDLSILSEARENPPHVHGDEGSRLPRRLELLVVALLVTAWVGLTTWNAATTSPTVDEPVHLAAGYTYLASGDYRLNPEHPPLVKLVAAIPVVLSGELGVDPESGAPRDSSPQATRSNAVLDSEWAALVARGDNWRFVHEFLYGARDGVLEVHGAHAALELPSAARYEPGDFLRSGDGLVFRARLAMVGFGLALGLLIYAWARSWFGPTPAFVSLALFAFDPNFIAHGGLVTTDVAAAMAILACVLTFVRALEAARVRDALAFALAVAVAAVVKFSTVVLAPTLLIVGLLWALVPGVAGAVVSTRQRMYRIVRLLVVALLAGWVGIWVAYGFRFDAVRNPDVAARLESELAPRALQVPFREPGRLPIEWTLRRAAVVRAQAQSGRPFPGTPGEFVQMAADVRLSPIDRALLLARDHGLFPESYLMGISHLRLSLNRGAYLNGRISGEGFGSYFFWTALYKTSLPALLLLTSTLAAVVFERRRRIIVLLVVPAAIYLTVAVGSGLNIGHRHILPVYPFLYVAAGHLAARWTGRGRVVGVAVAVGALALSSLVVFSPRPWSLIAPHHLSFFNEIAGGPVGGPRHLVDSNCDWGQDLPALRDWVEENGVDGPIQLSYFGSGDPRAYGIPFIDVTNVDPRGLTGLIAISVTNRSGVLWSVERREAWNRALDGARLVGRAGYSILIYERPAPGTAAEIRDRKPI